MNSTQHRLVSTYLDDLTRALADLDPADRAEVLAGVREHIEAGLAARGGTSGADVRGVLSEVGTPEEVAREAYSTAQYAERPAPHPAAPPAALRLSDRPWVPVLVAILQALGVLFILLVAGASASYMTTEVVLGGDGIVESSSREVSYTSNIGAVLASGITALPLWIVIALFVGNSTLWTSRQKVVHLLLMPTVLLLLAVLPDLGWALAGERGLNVASIAVLVVSVGASAWLIIRLTVAARGRAASR